jgi:ATP-dependent DNA helicase RecG
VGVEGAHATVMVVEQADRFGLAQLHQLRGRVGRGSHQSHCILVTGKMGEKAYERIKTLLDSSDGFYIAEMDLRLRGPGEFFGTRQSGLAALRIADLIRDREILELARSDTASLVENPPSPEELDRAEAFLRDHWQRRYGLSQVG